MRDRLHRLTDPKRFCRSRPGRPNKVRRNLTNAGGVERQARANRRITEIGSSRLTVNIGVPSVNFSARCGAKAPNAFAAYNREAAADVEKGTQIEAVHRELVRR